MLIIKCKNSPLVFDVMEGGFSLKYLIVNTVYQDLTTGDPIQKSDIVSTKEQADDLIRRTINFWNGR